MFLNLIGDGQKCLQQTRILLSISNVVVVMIHVDDMLIGQENDLLGLILSLNAKLIVAIDAGDHKKTKLKTKMKPFVKMLKLSLTSY